MAELVLVGAGGLIGGLVAAALSRRGHRFAAAGRDPERIKAAIGDVDGVTDVRRLDPHRLDQVSPVLSDAAVVLAAVAGHPLVRTGVMEAAVDAGCSVVAAAATPAEWRWLLGNCNADATARDITVVPSVGADLLPGDLLAALAASAVTRSRDIHISYALPDGPGLVSATTRRSRQALLHAAGQPVPVLIGGQLEEERAGEGRRLAWFPRPVGPHHAAAIPGGEPLTVPRHVTGVRTVRTYLAMRTWQAELFQLAVAFSRSPTVESRLRALALRAKDPSERVRAATRWACVVEARGASEEVARAWAYGRDPYDLTAEAMVLSAEAILRGGAPAGVVAPAELLAPADALDSLTDRTTLRWQLRPPDPR